MIKKLLLSCFLFVVALSANAQNVVAYIEEHANYAQTLMRENHIPASIILAVAIHESASGSSKIAQNLNNHFGVKGPNENTDFRSSYRSYQSDKESYSHFIEIMQTRSPFKKLFDKYDQWDYNGWARGIQRCGYAQSRTWASQVIAIIKKYELYQYDERPNDYVEPRPELVSHIAHKSKKHKASATKTYKVKNGDTLSEIAEAKGTTVKALKEKNGLKGTKVKPGQKLKY